MELNSRYQVVCQLAPSSTALTTPEPRTYSSFQSLRLVLDWTDSQRVPSEICSYVLWERVSPNSERRFSRPSSSDSERLIAEEKAIISTLRVLVLPLMTYVDNAGVIVNPKGEMKGSAVTGPVAKECAELWPRIAANSGSIIWEARWVEEALTNRFLKRFIIYSYFHTSSHVLTKGGTINVIHSMISLKMRLRGHDCSTLRSSVVVTTILMTWKWLLLLSLLKNPMQLSWLISCGQWIDMIISCSSL